jgi:anaerobic selenocysteine-containing dehydrogenase
MSPRSFMVLLFRRLYELRAEKAAEGGAKVVVVGPRFRRLINRWLLPTIFIKLRQASIWLT